MNITCPECGFVATAVKVVPWGDGEQKSPVAPYICSRCGAFAVMNLVRSTVEFMPPLFLEMLRVLNPEMAASIEASQKRIRAARKGSDN